MAEILWSWLPTYFLHSTLLLGGLALLERRGAFAGLSLRHQEWLWRAALVAGVASASLALWAQSPSSAPAPMSAPTPAALAPRAQPVQADAESTAPAPALLLVQAPQDLTPFVATLTPSEPDLRPTGAGVLAVLSSVWAVGGLLAALMLAGQFLALRRVLARLPLLREPRWQRLAQELAAEWRMRPPQLRQSAAWASPLLAPGRTVCLPAWAIELDDVAARAVLAHEMSHLRRHDTAWRLAGELLCRLLWLQPLNRWVLRRLDLLAELACDEAAAPAPAARTALAESLLRCAEDALQPLPPLACTAAGPLSPLALRVRQLLAGPSAPPPGTGRVRLGALLAVATLGLMALPVVAVREADALGLWERVNTSAVGQWLEERHHRVLITGDHGRHINLRGQAQFNDEGTELVGLQGRLEIAERQGGLDRRVVFVGKAGEAPEATYTENGEPKPLDAAAKVWLAGLLPDVAEYGSDPVARAKQLFARGGLEAVLADAERPTGEDYLLQRRLSGLLGLQQSLPEAALTRVFAVVGRMAGSFERREVLSELAATQRLPAAQQVAYLQRAAGIDGDFELREALGALAPQLLRSPEVLSAWQAALGKIDGDFELREALTTQIEASPDAALLSAALTSSERLSGDFERRELLSSVARHLGPEQAALVPAYLHSAQGISGDFERREALLALLDQRLSHDALEQVTRAAAGIDGSFERLQVLKRLAERAAKDEALIASIRRAARGMGEFERGQLETTLDGLGG